MLVKQKSFIIGRGEGHSGSVIQSLERVPCDFGLPINAVMLLLNCFDTLSLHAFFLSELLLSSPFHMLHCLF